MLFRLLRKVSKEGIRSVEQFQMGELAGEDEEEDKVEKKKTKASITGLKETDLSHPSPPMSQQGFLMGLSLSLSVGVGLDEKAHPIFKSSAIKMSSNIFNNIMRQVSFKKSLPIVSSTSGVLLTMGGCLSLYDETNSIEKSMVDTGQSLPFGELKACQLGKKVSKEKVNKSFAV